jgi:tetratricopeptide (TPR) repeat protein
MTTATETREGLGEAELAILGQGLDPAVLGMLQDAADVYANAPEAERRLRLARSVAPDNAAVLIGAYRFYFYQGRLWEALEVARICLGKAQRENGFAPDWRDVRPEDADFGDFAAVLPRFFLFTLKGYAYLHMRLGNLEEGAAAVAKLLELDPLDRVGAKTLKGVLDRGGNDDS